MIIAILKENVLLFISRTSCKYCETCTIVEHSRLLHLWSQQPTSNCEVGKGNWEEDDQPSRKIIEGCDANWIPLLLDSRQQVLPLSRPACSECTRVRLNAVTTGPTQYQLRTSLNMKVYYELLSHSICSTVWLDLDQKAVKNISI